MRAMGSRILVALEISINHVSCVVAPIALLDPSAHSHLDSVVAAVHLPHPLFLPLFLCSVPRQLYVEPPPPQPTPSAVSSAEHAEVPWGR